LRNVIAHAQGPHVVTGFFFVPDCARMNDERARLRRELRGKRRAIPPAERIAAAQSLAQRLLSLPMAPVAGHVAGYWAMDGEIALHAWQMQLPEPLTYCLPMLDGDDILRFAAWRPGDPLVTNRFGIPEPDVASELQLPPDAMAMVVVPVVGFDAHCQRLGMGGGWYDRSFAATRTVCSGSSDHRKPLLVGAAFAAQQVDAFPIQPWDVALDAVCTEKQTFHGTPTDR
jgi:5-formyltetrahydrofolate cyclo-ligase